MVRRHKRRNIVAELSEPYIEGLRTAQREVRRVMEKTPPTGEQYKKAAIAHTAIAQLADCLTGKDGTLSTGWHSSNDYM